MSLNSLETASKLDAVVPITLKDYDRFTILERTINYFCKDLFNIVWIVVPDQDLKEIKEKIKDTTYRVISDSELVPEFKLFPKRGGWFNQQLIKLAIASRVETDFYLTLDADVICLRPTHFSDLVKDRRAVYYQYSPDKFEFPEWYEWAYKVLSLPGHPDQVYYNVTPSVLSRDAVLQLQAYLLECSSSQLKTFRGFNPKSRNSWLLLQVKLAQVLLPRGSQRRQQLLDWRSYLLRSIPWTEYSLYYTFCTAQGLLDRYHIRTDNCLYSTESSIWYKEDYTKWNPASWFSREQDFFFCVLQSTTEISPVEVWEQIEPYLLINNTSA